MANALAKTNQQKTGITTYLNIDAVKQNIISAVGKEKAPRFMSAVISAVQANPDLGKCSNTSILSAALLGESLNLTPSPQLGQYYLVPFDNTKKQTPEAQFQLGYKGYIQLAIRSGQYRKIIASEVKDGEIASYNPVTEEFVLSPITDMGRREKTKTIGYYAMFELINGFRKEIYWSKEKMEEHAKRYSKGYASDLRKGNSWSFWSKDFDGMAKKTLLRQLISKWGIMSIDMEKAYSSDMAVLDDKGGVDYVDATDDVDMAKNEIAEAEANSEELIIDMAPQQSEMNFA